MKKTSPFVLLPFMVLLARPANAQPSPEAPGGAPAPPAAAPQAAAPSSPPPAPEDAGRFRGGINATAGLETVSASGASASGAMFGLDFRLGWQFNNLFALYAQPHLSFGSLSTSAAGVPVSGGTGTAVGAVMGELTFIDRLFVGAGAGYGVLNNPSGATIEVRAGGYPLMGHGENGIRRKGLMLGGDFRSVFVTGATGTLLMACIGYEAF
jgi:hypothetical protein